MSHEPPPGSKRTSGNGTTAPSSGEVSTRSVPSASGVKKSVPGPGLRTTTCTVVLAPTASVGRGGAENVIAGAGAAEPASAMVASGVSESSLAM